MTRTVITETETGKFLTFDETPEERWERIERASRELTGIHVTVGQLRELERIQERMRRLAESA